MQKTRAKAERGSALLWGLVILLVMTVIGVAASRMSATDTRIAGNQMMYMLTYQGADSMLRRYASLFEILQTAKTGVAPTTVTPGVVKVRKITSADGYSDSASGVTGVGASMMGGTASCPPMAIAMSTEMTPDSGSLACRVFTTEADTALSGTGARSMHSEGILKIVPATP